MTPARRTALALPLAAAAVAIATAAAPNASATDAPTFTFPQLGTVVVDGTVADDLNYTVYRILDPTCTGTAFPGPNNSCVPQEATDTLVIPAGTYTHEQFKLSQVPACGPTQQDVYDGAYQPRITASGTHDYVAGGILQLTQCAAVSPSPSSSTTTATPSPVTTPGRNSTTGAAPTTSAPAAVTGTPTTAAPITAAPTGAAVLAATAQSTSASAYAATGYGPQLASTGPDHTTVLFIVGIGAVAIGSASLVGARRMQRGH